MLHNRWLHSMSCHLSTAGQAAESTYTHYPFAATVIGELLPGTVLLDGGAGTAGQTKRRLENAGLLQEGPGEIRIENSLEDPAILLRSNTLLGINADAV